jgi:hypothetical protein
MQRSRLKKADGVLIAVLFLLSFLPLAIYGQAAPAQSFHAEITVAGKVVEQVPLSAHRGRKEWDIETAYGTNHVVVDDDRIRVTDSDCPDQLCIKQGAAQKAGDRIVCLPHRLMIEIKGGESTSDIVPAG